MNQQNKNTDDMGNSTKVPFREKIALGVGGFSNLFAYIGINTVARTVYVMILGVNAAWIGVALTIIWTLTVIGLFFGIRAAIRKRKK